MDIKETIVWALVYAHLIGQVDERMDAHEEANIAVKRFGYASKNLGKSQDE
jgi:hypothetical protein